MRNYKVDLDGGVNGEIELALWSWQSVLIRYLISLPHGSFFPDDLGSERAQLLVDLLISSIDLSHIADH